MTKLLLVDRVFGELKVIKEVDSYVSPKGRKTRKWLCECVCGNKKEILQNALTAGLIKSCGCTRYLNRVSRREDSTNLRVGCDRADSRYNVWSMMIQRCYEENHSSYESYGGSGKTVCDSWLEPLSEGFLNFCKDMGERPNNFKLDRKNNELGYNPENCRWVDDKTSVINRGLGRNNTSGVKGVTWCKNTLKWKAQIGVDYKCLVLGYSEDWFEAVCLRKVGELKYFKEYL